MKADLRLPVALFAALVASMTITAAEFRPEPSPNPWADDYTAVSPMKDYRSWGTYNVHDPAICRVGDTYYMYSTDAIYRENRKEARESGVPLGFIQMRKSKDLVNWDFEGWAFTKIPDEAVEWVRGFNDGHGATNIWAPYMVAAPDGGYRLYYCVSAFGRRTSYIGLATASSPLGPWKPEGCVVKTGPESKMNAIDPTVITDSEGRQWMHYGSFFGGLYTVELNPATGYPVTPGDQGKLAARRADYRKHNLEAPEIIHNPANGFYYLFGSYDPLMTTYNVRVGRSLRADGPFIDFNGKEVRDTTDNLPILTAPYRFEGHDGWIGTAHCGLIADGKGRFYMAHQGRPAFDPAMMDLHVRRVFFTPSGWPVVSPQRYTGLEDREFSRADLVGDWELIRVHEPRAERELEAGQIRWGEGMLRPGEWSDNASLSLAAEDSSWAFDEKGQLLSIVLDGERINDLVVHYGHDWERQTNTVLFTGLDAEGRTVWGKRIR